MKWVALAVTFLVSASALADADLSFVSLTSDKTQYVTGERYRLTAKVANLGPDAARNVRVNLSQQYTALFVEVTPPAGWTCTSPRYANGFTCSIGSFANGAEAEFSAVGITPHMPATRFTIGGMVLHEDRDPVPSNLGRGIGLSVVAAPTTADLTVSQPSVQQVRPGTESTIRVLAANTGPDEARNVAVVLEFFTAPAALSATGSGWQCETTAPERVVCTRGRLAAGVTAPIDLRFTAPASDGVLSAHSLIVAELNHDPKFEGSYTTIFIGAPENWRMMLIPLSGDEVRGPNGARWTTELRMLVRSATAVEIRPHLCDFSPIPECFPVDPPLGAELDPKEAGFILYDSNPLGQFLYVRAADFEKVRMNGRVYDKARTTQTAGAELPIPRDDEFTFGTIDLLNIPVAPQYRHTLRVYDADGRAGSRVVIRVYAGSETEPRVTREVILTRQYDSRVTTARLPADPAIAQLDLGQLLPPGGTESLRVEVIPADPGVRLWAFVSITNNETHHVTMVTPQ